MGWRFMVVLLAPAAFGFVMVPALSVASGQPRPTRPPVSVKPLSGGATTRVGGTFRAPDRAGRYGNLLRRYSIATTGGSPGCQASAATIRTSARKDELLHVTLAP